MKTLSILAAIVATMALPAHALTVYSNDFDSAATVGSGVSAVFAPGAGAVVPSIAPYFATYGNFLRSNSNSVATELTLSSLPGHTAVDVDFVVALLDSWDSRDGGCCSPDNLDLYIDGTKVASYTYNNALGTIKDIGGGTLVAEYVQFDGNVFYSDTVADMAGDPGLVFAHTGSTLKVGFVASGAGWQGGTDEAWGVDNLHVEVLGVPEPSTYALMVGGLAGLAAVARRRRAR